MLGAGCWEARRELEMFQTFELKTAWRTPNPLYVYMYSYAYISIYIYIYLQHIYIYMYIYKPITHILNPVCIYTTPSV